MFLLGYFYLRIDADGWPPAGIASPDLIGGIIPAVLIVGSAGVMNRGLQRIRAGDSAGLRLALAVALVLAAAGTILQVRELTGLGFGWTEDAYGSIFFATAGFCVLAMVGASIMAAMTLFWSSRGYYSARRTTIPTNAVRLWSAMATIWVVGFGVLYLAPRLT